MIILCADDYALTEGVSRAVGELAAARRLSATSAMVTTPCWPAMAQRLVVHRGRIAVGLHLNLTLGGPLGAMPRLAPGGMFSKRNALLLRALLGLEVAREDAVHGAALRDAAVVGGVGGELAEVDVGVEGADVAVGVRAVVIGSARLHRDLRGVGGLLRLRVVRLVLLVEERRQGDRGEDAEDEHDDEELDQGETCLALTAEPGADLGPEILEKH